jgi:hypothetical protein
LNNRSLGYEPSGLNLATPPRFKRSLCINSVVVVVKLVSFKNLSVNDAKNL